MHDFTLLNACTCIQILESNTVHAVESDLESDEEHQQLTAEQQVEEALQHLSPASDLTARPCVTTEELLVAQFAEEECGCSRKSSAQFSINHLHDTRAQCYELSHDELDMVLLGQLMASCNDSDHTAVESRHQKRERQKKYTTFHHAGKIVCGKTFRFLHVVGEKRVYNLSKSLGENGLTPRTHGNKHKRPKHSLSFESTEYVVRFLISYAEQHALLLQPFRHQAPPIQCVEERCMEGVSDCC